MSLRDVVSDIDRWLSEGQDVALATVVRTWGSGPRGPGAKMAFTSDARISGSVSGGCVESAVVQEGRAILEGEPSKLLRFGVADETAWEVGLSCGGTIEVFVQRLNRTDYEGARDAMIANQGVATATVVGGDNDALLGASLLVVEGRVLSQKLSEAPGVADAARRALESGRPERSTTADGLDLFVGVELPPPTLVAVGGVHIAIALTHFAKTLGYRTVVIDPRQAFGSAERFPEVDQLLQEWPDQAMKAVELNRSSAVATLTHDPKLDDPALEVALRSPAFYVGALGSAKTRDKRRRRLLERGLTPEELGRLHAPIGLAIGSRSPEEIALSVMSQIVAARNGALGDSK